MQVNEIQCSLSISITFRFSLLLKALRLSLAQVFGASQLVQKLASVYLTIRLQARVFYEQIVNEAQPS